MRICVFIPHFSTFFSFFTALLPHSSITDVVLSHARSPSSLLLKVSFSLLRASFAPLISSAMSLSFFLTFVCWSFKCWFIQEKGKSPLRVLIYTSYTRSESLHSPTLLMFPAQLWSTLLWPHPHATEEWEFCLTCREVQASTKQRARDILFVLSSEGYLQRYPFLHPGSPLTVLLWVRTSGFSKPALTSTEKVPSVLLSWLPCNTSYLTELEA